MAKICLKNLLYLWFFGGMFWIHAHPVIHQGGFVYWGEFSSTPFHLLNVQKVSYTFHPRFALALLFGQDNFLNKTADTHYLKSEENLSQPLGEASDATSFSNRLRRNYQIGLNTLIHRQFWPKSQANIYLSLRAGIEQGMKLSHSLDESSTNKEEDSNSLQYKNNFFSSKLDMDWESRKLYTALALSLKKYQKIDQKADMLYQIKGRLGFAPYIGGMDDLQTWLMVQFKTPFLSSDQFFKETKTLSNKLQITPLMRFFYQNALWEIGGRLTGGFFLTLMIHY